MNPIIEKSITFSRDESVSGNLPILHLCKKEIEEAAFHQHSLSEPDIAPIPCDFVFDRVIDTQNNLTQFNRSEKIEHLIKNGWSVVDQNKPEDFCQKYRKIKTAPNKHENLLMLFMADILKKAAEEESLEIEIAEHCAVELDDGNQEGCWIVLHKKPLYCGEQFLRELQKLSPKQQLKIAQDLCRLICKTGFLHVRIEDLGMQDGKLVLVNLSPCGLLRDISDHNPRFSPSIDECAQIGLTILIHSIGRNHSLFRHVARKALSMQKDKGLENDSTLFALDLLKMALQDSSMAKEEKLKIFQLLPPRLKEYFQFLVWVGMGKPIQKRFGELAICNNPEILSEIKNYKGVSLIEQVQNQFCLRNQLLTTQKALIELKAELLRREPDSERIEFAFNKLLDDFSRDFIYSPLQHKLQQTLQSGLETPEPFSVYHLFVKLILSGSSSCLLDQLIMALQSAREELSINSAKHRIRREVNRPLHSIPLKSTSKDQIDAKRFEVTLPKEVIQQRLRVVLVAYECAKFAVKFGGLGEAAYGIAKGLTEVGHKVSLILMKSDVIPNEMNEKLKEKSGNFSHSYKKEKKIDSFYVYEAEGIQLYYLEDTHPIDGKDHYYLGDRGNIYKDGILANPKEKWYGLKERMLYFSSAAAGLIKAHRKMFDLLIVNDWHGADAIRHLYAEKIPSIFIIHNNNYGAQGVFDGVSAEIPGFFGHTSKGTNIMLDAMAHADQVVTVSKTFALEMQGKALGSGIDPWVREIAYNGKFSGIVNGSNPDLWDPSTNKTLKEWKELRKSADGVIALTGNIIDLTYRATDLDIFAIKNQIKLQLQLAIEKYYPKECEAFQFDVTQEVLLFLGRYDSSQKGLDKLLPMIQAAREQNVTVVIMGVGEDPEATRILDKVEAYARENKGVWVTRGKEDNASLKIQLGSQEIPALGPLVRAAATFGAMPSSFEPCGLFQLECFLFGVPIIGSATGGLPDTVNSDKSSARFNGVLFERLEVWDSPEQDALAMQAVREAFEFWKGLSENNKRALTLNFMQDAKRASWTTSASGLSPIEQYECVFAAARKNVSIRQKKILDISSVAERPILSGQGDNYFGEGDQHFLYNSFGAHLMKKNGETVGVRFQVLAPNAARVKVVIKTDEGTKQIPMQRSDQAGVWVLSQKGLKEGCVYEYSIETPSGEVLCKADPFAFQSELRPKHGSVVVDTDEFAWSDQKWMESRAEKFGKGKNFPLNIYEVHLPSFLRGLSEEFLNYRELADILVRYCKKMHFTHIELLGLFEHPNDDSWGYQVSGYFSPTSRNGSLQDFQYFVNEMHKGQIGVLVDWVPFHFCTDEWSLGNFDGSPLYEDTDPFNGISPCEWGTNVFQVSKNDVRNFLISSALFSLDKLHLDGLRVDAVTHLIDMSWGRDEFTSISPDGSSVNVDGISMLKKFNASVHQHFPGTLTCAENWVSDAPDTTPIKEGGYGFDRRWSWEGNEIQRYLTKDDAQRKSSYFSLSNMDRLKTTHREIISISHDEVKTHDKSLFNKPPNPITLEERFANARLYLTMQAFMPGDGILTFMGCEFAQKNAWNHRTQLDFDDLFQQPHLQVSKLTRIVNTFYNSQPAFWSAGLDGSQFEWVDRTDHEHAIISYHRHDLQGHRFLVVHNFSTKAFEKYKLVFRECKPLKNLKAMVEVLNTNSKIFGGTGTHMNDQQLKISEKKSGVQIKIPSLSTVVFKEAFA